jgi:hypothetical protein
VGQWFKDYGTIVAAVTAVAVSAGSIWYQARWQRDHTREQWFRDVRLGTYVAFIRSAAAHREAAFWTFGETDHAIMGPAPAVRPDWDASVQDFTQRASEVRLAGPEQVAASARMVEYTCWHYRSRLDRDPFDWDDTLARQALDAFIASAQDALGVPSSPDSTAMTYEQFLKQHPLN